jgi:chromosome segregation protein
MYLKSLDIHGFKSFANKTKFEFHKGVTGIVGPNGCGKSNVVDAIRWVLGETSAKALRGGEMADVIFNGTDSRKPMGMAEVTLTMGDCEKTLKVEYNEVSITRRVFRDGKSEYRINNTICRLRDIHDLFMDTGIGRTAYSIMEQGKIDMLLSSKPEDRRQVFEEAAGITKFKKEKKEALRKLDYTQANLLRVSDVLAEQERRMNSLRRQVAKARRYQSLAKNVRVLDTHLGHRKFVEIKGQAEELRRSVRSLEVREHEIEQDLPEREQAVVIARDNAQELESQLSGIRQMLNERRNNANAAQSKIAFNNERQAELIARIEQNEIEIEETLQKLGKQEMDLQFATVSLGEITENIAKQELTVTEQDEKRSIAKAHREEKEIQLRDSRNESNRTQSLIAAAQAKIESALAQFEGNRERSRQLAEDEDKLRIEREEASAERQKTAEELASRVSKLAGLAEEFESQERSFQNYRGSLDATREAAADQHKALVKSSSRLEVLKQLVRTGEGLEQGTQAVLSGLDDKELYEPGIRGVLANFIQVEGDFTNAVESALGAHLQTVLVRDSMLAESIIDVLTLKKMGQAAIVPEDFIPIHSEVQLMHLPEGGIAWAVDKVKSEKVVTPIIERLLENVLIVEDLATALKLRPQLPGVTFASVKGAVLSAEGIVSGGAGNGEGSSVLDRQNEIRDLETLTDSLTELENESKQKLGMLEKQVSETREAVEVAREKLQKARVDESTLQGQLSLAIREVDSIESKISNVERERKELSERETNASGTREEMEADLGSARIRLEELENDQLMATRDLEDMMFREQDAMSTLSELKTNLAVERRSMQSAEEQQQPMAARLEELRHHTGRRESEIIAFRDRIENANGESGSLLEEIETNTVAANQLEMELEQASASRSGLLEAINLAEKAATEIRQKVTRITEQKGKEEVSATKFELRLENLLETTLERYQVDLNVFRPDSHMLLACIVDQKNARQTAAKRADDFNEDDDSEEVIIESEANEIDLSTVPGDEGPDWDFVENSVGELKRKLDSMGPVNVDAIEEFDELEERHNFVRGQYDDLTNSKDELIDVIERINVETRKRFSQTFEQIRKNFQEMFKLLFGEKGTANLHLVDEDDPLESGIDIIAKPPGKKLQSITLLSGGERSMTAVALLFSIYQIKPAPFCVLDELDAPLDESNIGRFLRVLDRFIDTSQFIIVTHSKRTMSRADVMYGVTMEEFGVSKPVGMRLTDEKDVDAGAKKSAAQNAALRLDAE